MFERPEKPVMLSEVSALLAVVMAQRYSKNHIRLPISILCIETYFVLSDIPTNTG